MAVGVDCFYLAWIAARGTFAHPLEAVRNSRYSRKELLNEYSDPRDALALYLLWL